MSEQSRQPPPLPPQGPHPVLPIAMAEPGNTRKIILRFLAGLLLGAAISTLVWVIGWRAFMDNSNGIAIFFVPGIKLIVGITLLFFRGWRSFAAGILVSIALGFLIFFGACAMHLGDYQPTPPAPTTQGL